MRLSQSPSHLLLGSILFLVLLPQQGCGNGGPQPTGTAQDLDALSGSPPVLEKLHNQANEFLGGGTAAFKNRLKDLRGYPIVINKWASWCRPCRQEFPYFRNQSLEKGKKIAFIGINSNDDRGEARDFLVSNPVSYPSYIDHDQKIAEMVDARLAFPATAFISSQGKLIRVHPGQYASESALAADIKRYIK